MKGKILVGSTGLAVVAAMAVFFILRHQGVTMAMPPRTGDLAQFAAHATPQDVPAFGFLDADDQPIDLQNFKGKLTLVNLWATWCAPCVKEMPSLEQLKTSNDGNRFAVVTISQDHAGRQAVTKFFETHSLTALPAYLDTSMKASEAFKIRGLPTTILLDDQGHELGRFEGAADWSGKPAQALIDWYLAKLDADKQP